MNKVFRQGIRHGIPIALGYLSVSFAFGMKAVSGTTIAYEAEGEKSNSACICTNGIVNLPASLAFSERPLMCLVA